MKKVLVTGGTGFIGRHAVAKLPGRGFDVHMTVPPGESFRAEDFPGASIHRCDLFEPEARKAVLKSVRPSHLLHLAWYAEPEQYRTSPENLRWVGASLDLLREFAADKGQRAVLAGTCAEYDWSLGQCLEWETPTDPLTLYGTCKNALHQIAERFTEQVGLSFAWGRVFFLYGPHEHPSRFIPSIIRSLLEGKPARCNYGQCVRDFLHVADVAGAFVQLLESDVRGPVNIASGQGVSLGQVASILAQIIGRKDLLQVDALRPSADNPGILTADVTRLSSEVGWRATYGLESGLIQTVEWWKQQRE